MAYYFVNKDVTQNPGNHHEVHKSGCYAGDQIASAKRVDLGYQTSDSAALTAAQRYYSDADGCRNCCPSIHRG